MGIFKLTALKFNMKHLKSIMKLSKLIHERQRIDRNIVTDYESEDEELNEKQTNDVDKILKEMNAISTGIPKLYTTTGIVFLMAPFLEYAILTLSGKKVMLPHVLPMWSPFENSFLGYSVVVLTEFASCVYCVGVHIAFDVICICAMIFISGQFSLLQLKVNKIGGQGKECLHSERRNRRSQERIKACHKQHRVLIK